MKLTLAQAKQALPKPIADKAIAMARDERIRFIHVDHRKDLYFAEDCKYWAYHDDGSWASIQVGGEWAGYVKNDVINKSTPLPVGAFVIERHLFLGKCFITVLHNNGIKSLGAQ